MHDSNWHDVMKLNVSTAFRFKRVFMVGIGGSGMCGIAEILLAMGFEVFGSDLKDSSQLARLRALGAKVFLGHSAAHVTGEVDVLVYSSAVSLDHVEIVQAKALGILCIRRAEMLSELTRFSYAIAVAGTHGKSTTTSMIECIFEHAGKHPTFVIGGRVHRAGGLEPSHAALGESKYFVLEADESDASFKHIHPIVAVITNIDRDHMDTYDHNLDRLKEAFSDFLYNLPFYGYVVACADHERVRSVLSTLERHAVTYGESEFAQYRMKDCRFEGLTTRFSVWHQDKHYELTLKVPGAHNALNATAAFVVAILEGIAPETAIQALSHFQSVARRFEVHEFSGCVLVDDYGHHPAEIEATIKAARGAYPGRRLVMAFQPHRYSRLKQLFEGFVSCLERVDKLVLLPVYSAGEAEIPSFTSSDLCAQLRSGGRVPLHYATSREEAKTLLLEDLKEGDVILIQGAGDVVSLTSELSSAISPLTLNEAS